MFLAGHLSQGCFGLQSHCTPCYFFNQASFYPSDFSLTPCRIPYTLHGVYHHFDKEVSAKSLIEHSEVVTLSCDDGFQLLGPEALRCWYGEWAVNKMPKCLPGVQCDSQKQLLELQTYRLPSPHHGNPNRPIRLAHRPPHGFCYCYFQRLRRFVVCDPMSYGPCELRDIANGTYLDGYRSGLTISHGSSVRYSCEPNFAKGVPDPVQCLEGKLRSDVPKCMPVASKTKEIILNICISMTHTSSEGATETWHVRAKRKPPFPADRRDRTKTATSEKKAFYVLQFANTESAITAQRSFRIKFGCQSPSNNNIRRYYYYILKRLAVFVKAKARVDQGLAKRVLLKGNSFLRRPKKSI
ncbi:uncharacterized protein TNCV_870111 [Trichonephila clavipes]|nr:uncharacterized protein TNCV_870111 [Trichonephila clavipes]